MLHAAGPVSPCSTRHGLPASLHEKFGCSPSKLWHACTWCSSVTTCCPQPCCLADARKLTAPAKLQSKQQNRAWEKGPGGPHQASSLCNVPSQCRPLPGIPMPLSRQRPPCEMGEHLVLRVQILAPKFLPGLWRGRAVLAVSPNALATQRGPTTVLSPALPHSSALQQPAFSLFVFLPLRAILSLPYAVIITNDNLTAALLFWAQQSHAPPPSLPPTALGQRLGSGNQGFLQFLPLRRIWTLFPSITICLQPTCPSITKGDGTATSICYHGES